jgi:hypothetical protein
MSNWEFEPYVAMSSINAASKCNKKSMIKFPQFLGRVSTMNKNKKEKFNYDYVKFFEDTPKPKKVTEIKEKKPRGRSKQVT